LEKGRRLTISIKSKKAFRNSFPAHEGEDFNYVGWLTSSVGRRKDQRRERKGKENGEGNIHRVRWK